MSRQPALWKTPGPKRCSAFHLPGLLIILCLCLTTVAVRPAQAHAINDGYSMLTLTEDGVEYDLYLPFAALGFLDDDGDGEAAMIDLESQRLVIEAYLKEKLRLISDGVMLDPVLRGIETKPGDIPRAAFHLRYTGSTDIRDLTVEYNVLLDDYDPDHVSYLYLFDGDVTQTGVLDGSQRSYAYNPGADVSPLQTSWLYFRLGVEHILRGIDHLLFLLALLLAVRKWGDMIKIITAFTIAHSLTLILTSLGYLAALPWTEVVIAVSILYVAAENLWRKPDSRTLWRFAVTFGFGLIHGMGFAGALGEIGLPQGFKLGALLAFNLGVEAGQVAFALVALPLLLKVSGKLYTRYLRTGLSAGVMTVAAFWLVQRW